MPWLVNKDQVGICDINYKPNMDHADGLNGLMQQSLLDIAACIADLTAAVFLRGCPWYAHGYIPPGLATYGTGQHYKKLTSEAILIYLYLYTYI